VEKSFSLCAQVTPAAAVPETGSSGEPKSSPAEQSELLLLDSGVTLAALSPAVGTVAMWELAQRCIPFAVPAHVHQRVVARNDGWALCEPAARRQHCRSGRRMHTSGGVTFL